MDYQRTVESRYVMMLFLPVLAPEKTASLISDQSNHILHVLS